MRTCLGIVGVALGLLIVATLSMSWVIVYVHDRDEGVRLLVPAPVFLADIALRFGDSYLHDIELPPEVQEVLPMLPSLVEELAKAPDFEMLRVEQPGLEVSVRKIGDNFDLSVQDDDGQVHVTAPLSILSGLARAVHDGRVEVRELVGSLDGVSRTKLVDVRQAGQDVRVWIW